MFSNSIFAKGYGFLNSSLNYSRNDISPTLIKTFGIFGVVNFPLFYLLWSFFPGQEYNGMPFRMIAFVMCLLLALIDYWPQRLKPYLHAYWYLTIFYCLPFFGAYLFLENSTSTPWITNNILGLLWLVLVTDWLTFIIILPLGVFAGWFVHYCIVGPVQLPPDFISGPLTNYVWAIVIAVIFGKILHESKLNAMRTLAGAMAHELRTPLGGISLIAQVLKMHIPALVTGYKQAKEVNPDLEDADTEYVQHAPDEITLTTRNAFNVIDILLMNVKGASNDAPKETCHIKACIQNALNSYPLTIDEKALITCNLQDDFTFQGNELFMRHVIFNLLKNALYYVKAANKGGIFITAQQTQKENILIFKDTGKGMPSSMVPHVFDRFYSKTQHGTGIGLAFCKSVMESFGGKISCKAEENQHTTFILSFPKVS